MMKDYDKIFNSFKAPGAFNLLDSSHPLEFYVGIDDRGRKCLLLRSMYKPDLVKSTSAIEISIGQVKGKIWSIGFHLAQNTMSGLFYKFCDDLVESSRSIPNGINGMSFVIKRYNSWKRLFYTLKKSILSESEILGLIGELVFLKDYMIIKYGEIKALNSWSGADMAHKDFSVDDEWFEIKSSKSSSLTIKISSLEQLDSDIDGYLISYEFEKMSESFAGYSLNNIINDLLANFSDDGMNILLTKLKSIGWEYNDEYDKYNYRLVVNKNYKVSTDFPRIKKYSISPSIVKLSYELLKKDLDKFEVKKI